MSITVDCRTCGEPVAITLMPRGMWEVADQACDCEQDERAVEDALEVEMMGPEPDEDRLLARRGLGRWP